MTTTEERPALTLESVDPATGAVLAVHDVDDATAVGAAVAKARAAAQFWGGLPPAARKRHLLCWASRLVANSDELCALIHAENGKPVDDAYLEFVLAVEHISWAAKHAERVLAPQRKLPGLLMANFAAVVEQRPLGVVGVVGPWNYPIYTPAGSIAYALAAGNAVVFKPSEYTTSVGNYFAAAFAQANPDLPEGVLATVNGYGETGAALVRSGVDKIAFTGSTPTGKRIMAAAAENLTPVLLECGGKDAAIVAADADVKAAADAITFGAMANGGQTCVGVERVYVEKAVRDEFVAEVRRILATVRAGTSYGPMTMPSQIGIVQAHIDDALSHGGTAVVGGPDAVRPPFIDPVVLVDVDEDSEAVREETFGPTLTIRTVETIDEAVALANASQYGLASTVFSRKHGFEIARRLRAGATSINSALAFAAISSLPFGGVGQSGFGRIHGAPGLLEFTRSHSIAAQRFPIPGMKLLSFSRTDTTMRIVKKAIEVLHGRHT